MVKVFTTIFGLEDNPNAKVYFSITGVLIVIFIARYVASIVYVLMYM